MHVPEIKMMFFPVVPGNSKCCDEFSHFCLKATTSPRGLLWVIFCWDKITYLQFYRSEQDMMIQHKK